MITDGNDVVLKLLERNIPYASPGKVEVSKLMWGYKEEVASIVAKYGEPEVIIGADVILWPDYVAPLMLTIRWLLSCKPNESRCYISYVQRAVLTTVGAMSLCLSQYCCIDYIIMFTGFCLLV